jgi:hypothetical protein
MKRGFDWKEQAAFKRELRERDEQRHLDRAQRRQAAQDKATRLKAERDALLATSLSGAPASQPDRWARFKYIARPWRASWS